MDDIDDDNTCVNNVPECGAIFMSSSLSMNECFDRRVFALPSSKIDFVKHVRTGMILFLFEFEKRQLHGVFQATCDGTVDIVPHGFPYSGRRFPAQVRFKTIWFCHPLYEKEFKDAIQDNYFSRNKFQFGLSEYQVRRLLSLFNSKKVKKNPAYHVTKNVKDRAYVGSDGRRLSDRASMEYHDYKLSSDYKEDSFIRAKERELMKRDVANDEWNFYSVDEDFRTDNRDGFLTKKRRLEYQDRLFIRDLAEHENYADRSMPRSVCMGSPVEVRRSMDRQQLVTSYNENQVDELLNPVNKYSTELLEARSADYDQYMQRRSLSRDPNLGDGSNNHYTNRLKNYAIEGNMSSNDDGLLLRDCNSFDRVKPLVRSDHDFNLIPQARNMPDIRQRLLNEELEMGSVTASEPFISRMHTARRPSPGGMFPDNNRIEGEHGYVTQVTGSSSDYFSRPLDIDSRRTFYDRKVRLAEERVNDKMFDNDLCSTTYRSRGRVENVDDVRAGAGREMSKYYSPFSSPQRNFYSSEGSLPEIRTISTRLPASQNHHDPFRTFGDPTTTIATDPCIRGLSKAAHRCSASEAADWIKAPLSESVIARELDTQNSSFGEESHPYSLPMSSASQILPEPWSKSFNPNLSRHRVPHTYTPVDENLFTSNGQLRMASQYVPDHSTCNNHVESKDFKTKIFSKVAAYSPTAVDFSSKEHQKVSDASKSDPNTTRRSVFSRLAPAAQVGEDVYDTGVNYFDHCMEASVDEVMEMLLPCNNPEVVAQPKKPVEFDLDKKRLHSAAGEKNLNDSVLSNEESVDEVPKESRTVEFKRRSQKRRSLVGITYESATDIDVTLPKGEAGNPPRKTMRHKRLVRPRFEKTEPVSEVIGSDTTASRVPELTHVGNDKQNFQDDISNDKAEVKIGAASLSHQAPDDKKNDHSEEQKYIGVENCSLQVTRVGDGKQNCQKRISNVQTDASLSSHESPYDKKNDHSEEQKDLEVVGVENCSLLVAMVNDKQTGQISISNDNSEVQNDDASLSGHEFTHDKKNDHFGEQTGLGVETCSLQVQHEKKLHEKKCSLENSTIFLPKEVDSTVESLKHEEPSLEKLKPNANSSYSREGKKFRLVKRIVKKIVKIRKIRQGKGEKFDEDKPSSVNSQGKSVAVSTMNNHVPRN